MTPVQHFIEDKNLTLVLVDQDSDPVVSTFVVGVHDRFEAIVYLNYLYK